MTPGKRFRRLSGRGRLSNPPRGCSSGSRQVGAAAAAGTSEIWRAGFRSVSVLSENVFKLRLGQSVSAESGVLQEPHYLHIALNPDLVGTLPYL